MKTFENFELSNKQKECLKKANAKKAIRKYIIANGVEPSAELVESYHSYTQEQYDKYKKYLYACAVVDYVPVVSDKPEEIENTPSQAQTASNISDAIDGGANTYVAGEEETLNNVTIPASAPKSVTITGPVQDGASINNESPKGLTINNTNEDPIDINVSNVTASTTITLKGDGGYNDIYAETNKLTASTVNGTISLVPVDENSSMNVGAAWQDGSGLVSDATGTITISNSNSANEPSVNINTPNATVVMSGGQYDELTVTCSDNTLKISGAFHAKKLIVKKGTIEFGAADIHDLVDELVIDDEVKPNTYEISNSSIAGFSKNGISEVVEDVVSTSRVGFGIFANGTYRYNFNGHSVTLKGSTAAAMYFRGSGPTISIYGPGKIVESSGTYGIWTNGEDTTVNIYGCGVEAYTHALYSYLGTINVYGGSFKLLDAEPELDQNGHHKFLLNCYDANYTAGKAHINVYGGKFYNFNPAEAYSEPGSPVSYVAEGYHVVESVEDGVPVFEVVAD